MSESFPLLRIRDRNDKLSDVSSDLFKEFRQGIARKTRGFLAPEYNVRCVEAAVQLDFESGLEREQELFKDLMKGTQSKAQQYYFFAERRIKIPDSPRTLNRLILRHVGSLGQEQWAAA